MSINFKLIGRRVKEIRCSKGMSQAELAEQIDMSVPYISLIETAAKKASLCPRTQTAAAPWRMRKQPKIRA